MNKEEQKKLMAEIMGDDEKNNLYDFTKGGYTGRPKEFNNTKDFINHFNEFFKNGDIGMYCSTENGDLVGIESNINDHNLNWFNRLRYKVSKRYRRKIDYIKPIPLDSL